MENPCRLTTMPSASNFQIECPEKKGPAMLIIERRLMKKPNLGGWRHKVTGQEFLNGDSQTGPRKPKVPPELTCNRKVQTVTQKDKEIQLPYSRATQMWRPDCYIAPVLDKYSDILPYKTFSEIQVSDVGRSARIIQRCYRAYRFIKSIKECARVYRELREQCDKLDEEKYRERRERYLSDCRAVNDPRTLTDMDALIVNLEENELGKTVPTDAPRCRALRALEERRRAFLSADQRMLGARQSRARRIRVHWLARHCQPQRWLDRKGRVVEMLSLKCQAARDCFDLYEQLSHPVQVLGEGCRMEILLKVRSAVESHDCRPADNLRDLIDQELVMTAKDVESDKFDFLRKRIVGAFLQFIQTSHNCTCKSVDGNGSPSINDYEFREPLETNKLFCTSCNKLLPRSKFPVTSTVRQINKCKACVRLHVNVRGHVDLKPYESMHTAILKAERDFGLEDSLADALSPLDLRHLAHEIWHGRSVLSERSDPRELCMPRYEPALPWSPWNCILLTDEEAEAHYCLGGGGKMYSEHLRRKIRSAHKTARIEFRGLVGFEGRIDSEKNDDSQPEQQPADVGCDNRSEDLIARLEL